MPSLWYTLYSVSSLTFFGLAYIDWQVPGFVSHVFPAYILLIAAIISGVAVLLSKPSEPQALTRRARFGEVTITVLAGLLLAATAVDAGGVFGGYRLVFGVVAGALPLLLLTALRQIKN